MPRVASEAAALIGRQISDRRKVMAITQDELAAQSGIDSSNIRAYENGRSMPNIYSLVRIAFALGIEPGDLLNGLKLEHFPLTTEGAQTRRG